MHFSAFLCRALNLAEDLNLYCHQGVIHVQHGLKDENQ